ncbi:hypothetical protein H2201_006871 [Coniosporium apollinis]|uniref:Uncharacterized protein n=2 Tax=Coniosporium TaxID=2810619 RepID=A0ABQ9NQY4_9PEZI|nr:hypothetical protein H2199_006192 [Cladosporium sp. JES 115]KAJ9660613.1 hypothetical protein H2201_006871 [Coniosporium apollinis]
MGGNAFSQGDDALSTPRMPPELYFQLKREYQEVLRQFYNEIRCPHEVPHKPDHGDLDFLVAGLKHGCVREDVAVGLRAERWTKTHPTVSYAVPLAGTHDQYVQVDVLECPPDMLDWEVFMKSYGDLLQILGHTLRNLGLTANDKGFYVRVPEIEARSQKESMLLLTNNPDKAMAFLGLDANKWHGRSTAGQGPAGFTSVEDIFEWCTSGRFFSLEFLNDKRDKSNDRRRLKQRSMFASFLNDWLPAHPEVGAQGLKWTRQEILELALSAFDKQKEYEKMMHLHDIMLREDALWEKVLKRWVQFENGKPELRREADMNDENRRPWASMIDEEDQEGLVSWVQENWEKAKDKEKSRVSQPKRERREGVKAVSLA